MECTISNKIFLSLVFLTCALRAQVDISLNVLILEEMKVVYNKIMVL